MVVRLACWRISFLMLLVDLVLVGNKTKYVCSIHCYTSDINCYQIFILLVGVLVKNNQFK